ncbi:MAG TPA: MBL fold metallo-hydrolase [Tepidisphaeraceae bacterium]|jgi:glyoxylase-like metal-dependent hydrolase (beta-lactamase superfamily II)
MPQQIRFDIISIGTLSRNRVWGESAAVRTAHATTTLIRSGKRNILVDPGLPAAALGARLGERTGLRPEQVDTVFLTNFRPAHRAGLAIFGHAKVLIHEFEQQATRQHLERLIEEAPQEDVDRKTLQQELELLERLMPADDTIADLLDLFPLSGYTPGTCGLLIKLPTASVMVAGDAVPTQDHFLAGQVLPDAYDIEAAQESMREVYEIADLIIPGHDNVFMNPRSAGM